MSEDTVESAGPTETRGRRRADRTPLRLPGRYLAPDTNEHECETVDVSPTGVRLRAPSIPSPGSRVIAYLDQLGRIEGAVVRTMLDGFAIAIRCTARKSGRIERRIDWLLKNKDARDRRASPRLDHEGVFLAMRTGAGREYVIELLDVSETGLAFLTERKLKIGDRIEVGKQKAAVARLFEGGAAANFI